MLITLGKEGFTTHLSCEDLLSGTESQAHCISCVSSKPFHTLQHGSCSLLISTMVQQEHHLSATE